MTNQIPILERDAFEVAGKSLPLMLVASADSGTIIWANQRMEAVFRMKRVGGLLGMCVDDLAAGILPAAHVKLWAQYELNPDLRPMGSGRKVQGKRFDGTVFDAVVILIPAHVEGQNVTLVEVIDVGTGKEESH